MLYHFQFTFEPKIHLMIKFALFYYFYFQFNVLFYYERISSFGLIKKGFTDLK